MSKRALLIVDDDSELRAALKAILGEAGYPVWEAEHGEHALAVLRVNGEPGLVLLDVHMPVMGGSMFYQQLRGEPALAHVPVVITTGTTHEELPEGLGDVMALRKPITLTDLLAIAAHFCGE
jgi:CheY-like chemotaxis protein